MSPSEEISLKEFFTSQLNNIDRRIVALEERTAKHSSSFNLKEEAAKLELKYYGLDESSREVESRLQSVEDELRYFKRITTALSGIVIAIVIAWLKQMLGL